MSVIATRSIAWPIAISSCMRLCWSRAPAARDRGAPRRTIGPIGRSDKGAHMHASAQPEIRSADSRPVKKVAYLMSRFPKITETFILYEILELEQLGMQIEVFPLIR